VQIADPRYVARLLRLGGERCREEAARDQRQKASADQRVLDAGRGIGGFHGGAILAEGQGMGQRRGHREARV
jgi:hypothetical protein